MGQKIKRVCFLLILGLSISVGKLAYAEVFIYVDEKGVAHFTNAPTNPRYRPWVGLMVPASRGLQGAFAREILAASRHHQVDPSLIQAVIQVESGFNPHAVSPKGARGLMQLMPQTAGNLEVEDPFDPPQNIYGGVKYLRYLMELFNGNVTLALAAYNAGEGAVLRYQTIPPYRETENYVQKVLSLYKPRTKTQNFQEGKGEAKKASPKEPPSTKIYTYVDELGLVRYTNLPPLVKPGKQTLLP